MAAGDLLDAGEPLKKQLELQGVLTGEGTPYRIAEPGIDGLGVPPAKTNDGQLDGEDGTFAGGPDRMGVRVLLVPYLIEDDDPAVAGALAEELEAIWEPVDDDVELHLQIRGKGHVFYVGRPRGLPFDYSRIDEGVLTGVAEFHCLNPREQRP